MSESKVLFFDWKESPCYVIDDFKKALLQFGVYITEVNANGDAYAAIVSREKLTEQEAQSIYEMWLIS